MRRVTRCLGAAALVALVTGCGNAPIRRFPAHYTDTQADAGTTTVAVVAVERWRDVVADLRPQFTLNGDNAVVKVLPITQLTQDKILDVLGFGASVGLPNTTLTRTETLTEATGQAPTRKVEETEKTEPGKAADPKLDVPGSRTAAGIPNIDVTGVTLGKNPILEYQTALALFQEVKLLNRYVESAAQRHGFAPYLVRLQIGVTPYAARQPYDVYSRISFHHHGRGYDDVKLCEGKPFEGADPAVIETCKKFAERSPELVPLVVTDDIEAARQSRSVDIARQLALNLGGTVQNVALNAQLQALNEQLQAVLGNTLNSLSSVTRLNDNTIQARFGAVYDPSIEGCPRWATPGTCLSADRSMVVRNYFVTLLVLVPEPMLLGDVPAPLSVAVQTDLRRSTDGARFKKDDLPDLPGRLRTLIKPYMAVLRKDAELPIGAGDSETALRLLNHVSNGRTADVRTLLGLGGPPAARTLEEAAFDSLWAELSAFAAAYEIQFLDVDLPRYDPPRVPTAQLGFLMDDGDKATRVRLVDGLGLGDDDIAATLHVRAKEALDGKQGVVPHAGYAIPAEGVTVAPNGRELVITFPSLSALGFGPTGVDRYDVTLERKLDRRYLTFLEAVVDSRQSGSSDSSSSPQPLTRGLSGEQKRTEGYAATAPSIRPLFRATPLGTEPVGTESNKREKTLADKLDLPITDPSRYACEPRYCVYRAVHRATGRAAADPGVKVTIPVKRIVTSEGRLALTLTFPKDGTGADAAVVTAEGAVIAEASAGKLDKATYTLAVARPAGGGSAPVTLRFEQLSASRPVAVKVTGRRDGKDLGPIDPTEVVVEARAGG